MQWTLKKKKTWATNFYQMSIYIRVVTMKLIRVEFCTERSVDDTITYRNCMSRSNAKSGCDGKTNETRTFSNVDIRWDRFVKETQTILNMRCIVNVNAVNSIWYGVYNVGQEKIIRTHRTHYTQVSTIATCKFSLDARRPATSFDFIFVENILPASEKPIDSQSCTSIRVRGQHWHFSLFSDR